MLKMGTYLSKKTTNSSSPSESSHTLPPGESTRRSVTSELGYLKSLKSMDLSNNFFTGEIPESFSDLKNLTLLNLFRNKLHDSISDFIGVLQLWEKNFTGSVPQGLGSSGKLQILDKLSNKLTGSLPSNVCSGNKLETLIILGNFLFGSISESNSWRNGASELNSPFSVRFFVWVFDLREEK